MKIQVCDHCLSMGSLVQAKYTIRYSDGVQKVSLACCEKHRIKMPYQQALAVATEATVAFNNRIDEMKKKGGK